MVRVAPLEDRSSKLTKTCRFLTGVLDFPQDLIGLRDVAFDHVEDQGSVLADAIGK
jgi:hypothetical protein